jgi:hypothetical protein
MSRRLRRRAASLVVVVALVAAAAACGGGGGSSSASGGDKTPAQSPGDRTIRGPACEFIVAGTERRFTRPLENTAFLEAAVAEPTTCYDKITFAFNSGDGPDLPPGYNVEYREPPFDYEGVPNSTAGFDDAKAVLVVEFQPASTTDARNPARPIETYKGNLRLGLVDMEHTVIVEWLSKLEDLTPETPADNKVVWLIGLDRKMPFTVDAANQPPRVSVLIMKEQTNNS